MHRLKVWARSAFVFVSIVALPLVACGCANPDGSPRYTLPDGSEQAAQAIGAAAGAAAAGPAGAPAGAAIAGAVLQILAALGVIGTAGGGIAYAHSRGRHIGWDERSAELDKPATPK